MKRLSFEVALISILTLFLVITISSAYESDADVLPTLSVYHTDSGEKIKGAILDDAVLEIDTRSTPEGMVYVVESGSILVNGSTYLKASGSGSNTFLLSTTVIGQNNLYEKAGFVISFYDNPSCSGNPVFSAKLKDYSTTLITQNFQINVPYYIQVKICDSATFTERPVLKNVGFSFLLESGANLHAIYFNDGMGHVVDQKLVTNGDRYTLPPTPVRLGYTFLGWFVESPQEYRINEGDIVNLSGDTTAYAHWIKGSGDYVEVITPSGDDVILHFKPDTEKGMVVDLHGEDPEGNVLIDMKDVDMGPSKIDLHFEGGVGKDLHLDIKKANDILEIFDAVRETIDGKAKKTYNPDATLDVRPGDLASSDPVALGMLSDRGFSLIVITETAKLHVDPKTLKQLSTATDDVILRAKISVPEELTPQQKKAIGSDTSITVTLESGGVQIHNFDGYLTVELPYAMPSCKYTLEVYCVKEDGTLENMYADYADGVATFKTNHLSVFMININTFPDTLDPTGIIIVATIVLILTAYVLYRGLVRQWWVEEE